MKSDADACLLELAQNRIMRSSVKIAAPCLKKQVSAPKFAILATVEQQITLSEERSKMLHRSLKFAKLSMPKFAKVKTYEIRRI